jgi:hypothetical protein
MKYSAVSAYCDIKKMAKAAPRIKKTNNALRKTISLPPSTPSSREIVAPFENPLKER